MDQSRTRTLYKSSKLLENKGKALSLVRKSLCREAGGVDNLAIMAVAFLAAVEVRLLASQVAPFDMHDRTSLETCLNMPFIVGCLATWLLLLEDSSLWIITQNTQFASQCFPWPTLVAN